MNLLRIGSTDTVPPTVFLWSAEQSSLVEITDLGEAYLVRASKAYRLLKQGEDGRETWNRKIRNMNDYLAETFPSFRISVDYVNQVSSEVIDSDAEKKAVQAKKLFNRKEEVDDKIKSLHRSLPITLEEFEGNIQKRINQLEQEMVEIDRKLDKISENLAWERNVADEWESKGVMASYIFQFSTDTRIVFSHNDLQPVIENQLETVYNLHRRKIKQTLQGSNFRLHVEELEEPRVLNRLEHSMLLNPEGLESILDQSLPENVANSLKDLKKKSFEQYEAYSLQDIEVGGKTVERSKSTPAQAVASILQDLETTEFTDTADLPNNGPMIGTAAGTQQVVGFDPSEVPHLYIVGESGSGKSHLKRVLIENVASLGYNLLTINPGDTQNIGLGLPNEKSEDAKSILFNQYWIGDTRCLDKPNDLTKLFTGLNAATLRGLPSDEKQEFINDVFTKLSSIDSTDQPLFVFLDEAHNFNQGAAANSIQKIARESRKFGVNLVIASQSPTDYSYNQRHVRENTTNIFLNGEYFDYAENFLDDGNQISRLDTGQCIIPETRDLPRMTVDVRDVLTRFWEHTPSEEEINEVAQKFEKQIPDFEDQRSQDQELSYHESGSEESEDSEPDLTEDEEKVVEAIQEYIRQNDERPSKNKTVESSPFGTGKTSRILNQLLEKNAVRKDTETRYGNKAQVFSVSKYN